MARILVVIIATICLIAGAIEAAPSFASLDAPEYTIKVDAPEPDDDPCSDRSLEYYIKLYFETLEHGNKLTYYNSAQNMRLINELSLMERCGDKVLATIKRLGY